MGGRRQPYSRKIYDRWIWYWIIDSLFRPSRSVSSGWHFGRWIPIAWSLSQVSTHARSSLLSSAHRERNKGRTTRTLDLGVEWRDLDSKWDGKGLDLEYEDAGGDGHRFLRREKQKLQSAPFFLFYGNLLLLPFVRRRPFGDLCLRPWLVDPPLQFPSQFSKMILTHHLFHLVDLILS